MPMSKNYKRNLRIGFGVSLLILMITSVASFVSIRNLLNSADQVDHTNEVITQLNRIDAKLRDAEAAQRGYLLTNDKDFLSTYENSKRQILVSVVEIKQLTIDNPQQQISCDDLRKLIDERLRVMDHVITVHDSTNVISTSDLQRGKDITDSIRITVEIMQTRERQLLVERTESMNMFANFTPILIIAGAVIAVVITISFYSRVSSDFAEKTRLQGALEEKDRLITQRIDIIRGIADKISAGNYSVRVSDAQGDALGNVAG